MLAQEQAVALKKGLIKSVQGTLVLTNQRVIFASGDEEIETFGEEVAPGEAPRRKLSEQTKNIALSLQGETGVLAYSDVDSLPAIAESHSNLSIALSSIVSAKARGGFGGPKLEVSWREGTETKVSEFEQTIFGRHKRRKIGDWAEVIAKLQTGGLTLRETPSPPGLDKIDGRVAQVMGDLQEKGILEIEDQVEKKFKVNSDPDQIRSACETLVSAGFLRKVSDPSGEDFYEKVSPLD